MNKVFNWGRAPDAYLVNKYIFVFEFLIACTVSGVYCVEVL